MVIEPSPVQYADNGDVRLAYETFGDVTAGEPLLLIMGLDFQMLWWHDDLCRALVDRGFAVVRFDNRDAGLSTRFTSESVERPWRAQLGLVRPAYTTLDMVADGFAVMDAVDWSSAHVFGGSLGGAVAQAMGLVEPNRIRSVTSAMAMPADAGALRRASYIRPSAIAALARAARSSKGRDDQVADLLATYELLAGDEVDHEWVRTTAARCVERAPLDPTATQRQMSAGRGVRLPSLKTLRMPLLAISGEADPLVKVSGGRATARAAPNARFVSYPGMAHAIPPSRFAAVVDEVGKVAGLA